MRSFEKPGYESIELNRVRLIKQTGSKNLTVKHLEDSREIIRE